MKRAVGARCKLASAITAVALLFTSSMTAVAQDAGRITEADVGVFRERGVLISVYCGPRLKTDGASRRMAVANAVRAIVQFRQGVMVSGAESVKGSAPPDYQFWIQEDTLGVVGPVSIIKEDPAGGIRGDRWCVKIVEGTAQ